MNNSIFDNKEETEAVTITTEEVPSSFDEAAEADGKVTPPDDDCKRIIEAVLFAAGHPVTYAKLASVLNTTPSAAEQLVSSYCDEYNRADKESLPRGIMMIMFDGCCQLCTKEQYGAYIREALGIRKGGNLSQSSIEVLSIVAYNQPVTRAFVDTVRGVDSSYAVSSMCDKHLIEACGRLDVPGRPLLYRTTPDFLRVFGLSSLDELPKVATAQAPQDGAVLPLEGIMQNDEASASVFGESGDDFTASEQDTSEDAPLEYEEGEE